MDQVNELESAILARANRLAEEYKERAKRSRDNILREAHERLHLREQREVLVAQARAERAYRRKVQASEIRLRKEMDYLRWSLVEGVREQLVDMIKALVADEARYLPILKSFVGAASAIVESDHLIAEVNGQDIERLHSSWTEFVSEAAAGKRIELSPTPLETLGGVLIRTADNRIRFNNTFEGRMEQLSNRLHQLIIERLFPGGTDHSVIFTG